MELKQLIISLCGMLSVSGYEYRSFEKLRSLLGDKFDEMERDSVGNILLIRKCEKDNAARVLVDTHFDEIGMIVTGISEDGFVSVAPIGGIDPAILPSSDVVIYGKRDIRGVLSSVPPHLRRDSDSKKLSEISELFIDTGYPKEELEELISIGTPIGFAPVYTELLNRSICGKSFDNKACAAAAIFALSDIPKTELAADVYLLLSAHEESVRTGGVAPAAFGVDPDYAMVIDVNLAAVPDVPKSETVEYGKGISISVSAITDRRLTKMTEELCRDNEIGFYRVAAPSSTGTNAAALCLVGRGVPTVDVGLPLKSMHTYNETISLDDAEALSALVRHFVCSEKIKEAFVV